MKIKNTTTITTITFKSLSLFITVLLLSSTVTRVNSLRSNLKKVAETAALQTSQSEMTNLWDELFTEKRGSGCKGGVIKNKSSIAALAVNTDEANSSNIKQARKADNSWIKKWGYGEASYLFDYLDPVFQKEIVAAFKKLDMEASAVSNKDTEWFQDPFNIQKLTKNNSADLKSINKNYNPAVYNKATNAVQLNEVMKNWHWFINPGDDDYAVNFIYKYDLDGDGRINPRELVLGAIMHNKDSLTTSGCDNCFIEIAFKLEAMFVYLDCNSDGFLSAEDLWNNLPKLNRPVSKYNIFALKNSDNIRTSAVNDFVIKNSYSKDGSLTKEEFRTGILLGYWDRQTRETGIVEDDTRNLKSLRWNNGGMTDTVAFNYMKENTISDMIAKS